MTSDDGRMTTWFRPTAQMAAASRSPYETHPPVPPGLITPKSTGTGKSRPAARLKKYTAWISPSASSGGDQANAQHERCQHLGPHNSFHCPIHPVALDNRPARRYASMAPTVRQPCG